MASIVGHAFAGVIAKQTIRKELSSRKDKLLLCFSLFLALIPDFDIIIYLIFKPSGMIPHRGISHGIPFILSTAFISTLLTVRYFGISKPKLFFICFFSLFSHIVLDYLMGAGPPIAFFAPFYNEGFLSPISLIPWAFYSKTVKGYFQLLFYPPAILGYCLEILIFTPIILLLRKPEVRIYNIILILIFIFAIISTYSIYNLY